MAPEHHIRIDGTLKPRSKFLGNSAASMMEGIAVMRFLNTGERLWVQETEGIQAAANASLASSRNLTCTPEEFYSAR